jgi:hypothetical protein
MKLSEQFRDKIQAHVRQEGVWWGTNQASSPWSFDKNQNLKNK